MGNQEVGKRYDEEWEFTELAGKYKHVFESGTFQNNTAIYLRTKNNKIAKMKKSC